ncbi:MAG TPA: type II toxin-antitoxin system RelE/ParE family toxin [Pyrinomonadaceae bacterium]|jgi:putative addiction module killer protein
MMVQPKEVRLYVTAEGRCPFENWLNGLRDRTARAAIDARIARLRLGLVGHVREVGDGVHELKADVGQGYRVYFGNVGATVVVLLCGGDKRGQKGDIKRAQGFWADYKQRTKG